VRAGTVCYEQETWVVIFLADLTYMVCCTWIVDSSVENWQVVYIFACKSEGNLCVESVHCGSTASLFACLITPHVPLGCLTSWMLSVSCQNAEKKNSERFEVGTASPKLTFLGSRRMRVREETCCIPSLSNTDGHIGFRGPKNGNLLFSGM
jgi:hypothetical protein